MFCMPESSSRMRTVVRRLRSRRTVVRFPLTLSRVSDSALTSPTNEARDAASVMTRDVSESLQAAAAVRVGEVDRTSTVLAIRRNRCLRCNLLPNRSKRIVFGRPVLRLVVSTAKFGADYRTHAATHRDFVPTRRVWRTLLNWSRTPNWLRKTWAATSSSLQRRLLDSRRLGVCVVRAGASSPLFDYSRHVAR